MKNIIIICFCAILGLYLYGKIVGDDDSIKSASKVVIQKQIGEYKIRP